MNCPKCGAYGAPDSATGYDGDDLCPTCAESEGLSDADMDLVLRALAPELAPRAVSRYLAAIGKKGGEATSPKKQAASRANGKKGGRPKKEQTPMRCKPLRVHPVGGRFAVQAQIAVVPERWHTLATFDDRDAAQTYLEQFLRDLGID